MGPTRKLAVAVAVLLAAGQAYAQVPTIPGNQPPATGPYASATASTGSSLVFTAWDNASPLDGISVIQHLNVNFSDFEEGDVTPNSGGILDFGILDGWNTFVSTLSSAVNLRWSITAVSRQPAADFSGLGAMYTRPINQTTGAPLTTNTNVSNNNLTTFVGTSVSTAYMAWIDSGLQAAAGCANDPTCTSDNVADPQYTGDTTFPKTIATGISTVISGYGIAAFYQVAGAGDSGGGANTPVRYANTAGNALFRLATDGRLTYELPTLQVVPLPAAAWLLLSGLAGFGAVSTRRRAS